MLHACCARPAGLPWPVCRCAWLAPDLRWSALLAGRPSLGPAPLTHSPRPPLPSASVHTRTGAFFAVAVAICFSLCLSPPLSLDTPLGGEGSSGRPRPPLPAELSTGGGAQGGVAEAPPTAGVGGFHCRRRGCGLWRQVGQEPSISLAPTEALVVEGRRWGRQGPRCWGEEEAPSRAPILGSALPADGPGPLPVGLTTGPQSLARSWRSREWALCCQQGKRQGLYCEDQLQGRKNREISFKCLKSLGLCCTMK